MRTLRHGLLVAVVLVSPATAEGDQHAAATAVAEPEGSVYSALSDDIPARGGFSVLKQYMSEDEFAEAGFHKLSTEELRAVQGWAISVQFEGVAVVERLAQMMTEECQSDLRSVKLCGIFGSEELARDCLARQREGRRVSSAAPSEATVIESRIDGDFEGWEGDTIFKLQNGQVWQQVEYDYHYHYAYMPEVMIVRTSRGWVMSVDGVAKTIGVERLR